MNSELTVFNQSNNKVYCSLNPQNNEDKLALFNGLQNCDFRLNDEEGKEIKVKNLYVEERETVDKETGQPRTKRITILFAEDGTTHVTASSYFFFAIMKILNVFGTPENWNGTMNIEIVKQPAKNSQGNILTCKLKGFGD